MFITFNGLAVISNAKISFHPIAIVSSLVKVPLPVHPTQNRAKLPARFFTLFSVLSFPCCLPPLLLAASALLPLPDSRLNLVELDPSFPPRLTSDAIGRCP